MENYIPGVPHIMMFGSCFFEAIYDNSNKSISAPFLKK